MRSSEGLCKSCAAPQGSERNHNPRKSPSHPLIYLYLSTYIRVYMYNFLFIYIYIYVHDTDIVFVAGFIETFYNPNHTIYI